MYSYVISLQITIYENVLRRCLDLTLHGLDESNDAEALLLLDAPLGRYYDIIVRASVGSSVMFPTKLSVCHMVVLEDEDVVDSAVDNNVEAG